MGTGRATSSGGSGAAGAGGADALVLNRVSVPASAVAAFAIGNLAGSPKPLKVLVCVDSAATSTRSVLP